MMKASDKLAFRWLTAGVGVSLLIGINVRAATNYTNQIVNFAFQPPTRTIAVGDTIWWNNISGFAHSATAWNTNMPYEPFCGPNGGSNTFASGFCSYTFMNAGKFGYFCVVHVTSFGMVGTITVT